MDFTFPAASVNCMTLLEVSVLVASDQGRGEAPSSATWRPSSSATSCSCRPWEPHRSSPTRRGSGSCGTRFKSLFHPVILRESHRQVTDPKREAFLTRSAAVRSPARRTRRSGCFTSATWRRSRSSDREQRGREEAEPRSHPGTTGAEPNLASLDQDLELALRVAVLLGRRQVHADAPIVEHGQGALDARSRQVEPPALLNGQQVTANVWDTRSRTSDPMDLMWTRRGSTRSFFAGSPSV